MRETSRLLLHWHHCTEIKWNDWLIDDSTVGYQLNGDGRQIVCGVIVCVCVCVINAGCWLLLDERYFTIAIRYHFPIDNCTKIKWNEAITNQISIRWWGTWNCVCFGCVRHVNCHKIATIRLLLCDCYQQQVTIRWSYLIVPKSNEIK